MSDSQFNIILQFEDEDINPCFGVRMSVGRYHRTTGAHGAAELYCMFEAVNHMEDVEGDYPFDDHAHAHQMTVEELVLLRDAIDSVVGYMQVTELKDEKE